MIDVMFIIFQYKDAFMKANPDYKWHNPDKSPPNQKSVTPKPTNVLRNEIDLLAEGSIMPGKLAGKCFYQGFFQQFLERPSAKIGIK